MEEVQQELTEFKEAKQELEEVQQEYARAQQELEGAQQELEEANSAVQKLTGSLYAEKEKCLVAHHANEKVTYVYIIFIATSWQVYAWHDHLPSSLPHQ